MALNGRWELVRNEGLLEHLIANGTPEDRVKNFIEGGKAMEIAITGEHVTISRGQGPVQKLKLGQNTTETLPDGKEVKITASLAGDELTVLTEGGNGKLSRVYSIVGSEMIVLVKSDKPGVPDGKRIYKRA